MRRSEIWSVSAGGGYAGKPRPAVIVQSDHFDATASITVCVFTSDETDAPLFRLLVDPDDDNGLEKPSRLMVDKITTVHRNKLGKRIGHLATRDLIRLDRAIVVFLGIA